MHPDWVWDLDLVSGLVPRPAWCFHLWPGFIITQGLGCIFVELRKGPLKY